LEGKKTGLITKSLSRLYLNRIKEMAKTNFSNGKAIDDYTSAEQAELTNSG
jgi:phage host-nuclease inhibitor protein Gam